MSTEATEEAESPWLERPVKLATYVSVIDGADGYHRAAVFAYAVGHPVRT